MREVEEETGLRLDASAVAFAALENAIFPTGQHYVVVFMMVDAPCGVRHGACRHAEMHLHATLVWCLQRW